ncbi:MAG TPA: riboflavin synthase [Vicinamibacterales bacterium]|jgi:riboflavin synthase|nr:riboflavin synthase [Vicinamibacterales bacterium]
MFTGLIETVATVARVDAVPSGYRLRLETPLAAELQLGESVTVDGVCLTVTGRDAAGWDADVGPETARVTTLGTLTPGRRVNLERSMRADSRFGGHLVQGHVDATGTVVAVRPDGDSYWLDVAFPEPLSPLFVPKGSVALNGVSLTVATLEDARFSVMIIPFTWQHTNLSELRAGATVNLECDMVGKYVARAAQWYRRP